MQHTSLNDIKLMYNNYNMKEIKFQIWVLIKTIKAL
uniref:Uncharacterized protein n=1 Tax=Rhizophora mucronata TaxID=61149 RepID=A0A2P2P2L9_RHIMU